MKILVINPNSDEKTLNIIMNKVAKIDIPDIEYECIKLSTTPKLISSCEDCAIATMELINVVKQYDETVDAYIIACFSDPGIDVLKELTKKPVVGIAEASMRIATHYGKKFSIISSSIQAAERKVEMARKYYSQELLNTIVVPADESKSALLEAGKKAVADHSQILLLGCGNYVEDDKWMENELKVKVLDGLYCAVILAYGMRKYQLYKDKK